MGGELGASRQGGKKSFRCVITKPVAALEAMQLYWADVFCKVMG